MTRQEDTGHGRNAVEVRGLVKHFGETRAVDGIDLDVREGTVMGVLGPNGAGARRSSSRRAPCRAGWRRSPTSTR